MWATVVGSPNVGMGAVSAGGVEGARGVEADAGFGVAFAAGLGVGLGVAFAGAVTRG